MHGRTENQGRRPAVSGNSDELGGECTVVVGLVADSGLATRVATWLADELPAALAQRVSSRVAWKTCVTSETVPLDADGDILMVDYARAKMPAAGWDLLVYLTELPQRVGTIPIVAEFSAVHGAAQVSLPGIGWVRLRPNVRETIVYLVDEMIGYTLEPGREGRRSPRPIRPRLTERTSPVRRVASAAEGIDAHLVLVGARGRVRLLFGMVRDNRPWQLVPSLSRATSTAAFGIFFSTVWNMADALPPRV